MASVGHIAIGMAAARVFQHGRAPRWSSAALWSALSLLPDADVIGFARGVAYAAPWGHRGASHSLTVAVALGLAIGLAARWLGRPARQTALVACVVLVSHGILDTMTDGGLGCALLWPLDLTRYFSPWRPIPVAPIGLNFFSRYGAGVAVIELVFFGPVLLFALASPRLKARPVAAGCLLVFWLVGVWLIWPGAPVRDVVIGFVLPPFSGGGL